MNSLDDEEAQEFNNISKSCRNTFQRGDDDDIGVLENFHWFTTQKLMRLKISLHMPKSKSLHLVLITQRFIVAMTRPCKNMTALKHICKKLLQVYKAQLTWISLSLLPYI